MTRLPVLVFAMASGFVHREKSAFGIAARLAGVSMMAGATALTRICLALSSSAMDSVRTRTAPFAAL